MEYKEFFKQMQRLASHEQKTMEDKFVEYWYKDLEPKGFTDEDVEGGVSRLIHKAVKFPSLGDLEKACTEKRGERINQEVQKQRAEENKHRHTTTEEILAKGFKGSAKTRALIANTLELLNGKIDKRTWIAKQREIGVDGHAERELRRMEKTL